MRSKVCQGVECVQEQNDLGSRVCVSPQPVTTCKKFFRDWSHVDLEQKTPANRSSVLSSKGLLATIWLTLKKGCEKWKMLREHNVATTPCG